MLSKERSQAVEASATPGRHGQADAPFEARVDRRRGHSQRLRTPELRRSPGPLGAPGAGAAEKVFRARVQHEARRCGARQRSGGGFRDLRRRTPRREAPGAQPNNVAKPPRLPAHGRHGQAGAPSGMGRVKGSSQTPARAPKGRTPPVICRTLERAGEARILCPACVQHKGPDTLPGRVSQTPHERQRSRPERSNEAAKAGGPSAARTPDSRVFRCSMKNVPKGREACGTPGEIRDKRGAPWHCWVASRGHPQTPTHARSGRVSGSLGVRCAALRRSYAAPAFKARASTCCRPRSRPSRLPA